MTGRAKAVTGVVCAMVLLLPFDLGVPVNGWTPLFIRPLLAVLFAIALVGLIAGRHTFAPDLVRATVIAALGLAFAALMADDRWLAGSVVVRLLLVLMALLLASSRELSAELAASAVLVMSVVASAIGFAVLISGEDLWFTEHLLGRVSQTGGIDRLTRPFSQANIAAMVLAPAALYLWAEESRTRIRTWVLAGGAAVAMVAVVLTLSRGGVLGLGIGLLWVATMQWRKGSRRAGASAVVAVAVASTPLWLGRWSDRLAAAPAASDRSQLRSETWTQAVDAFLASPFTGIGPGHFARYSILNPVEGALPAAHAHNLPLELLATTGLVGIVAFVPMASALAKRLLVVRPRASFAPVLAIAVHGLVDYPLVFTSSGTMVGLMLGVWAGRRERL